MCGGVKKKQLKCNQPQKTRKNTKALQLNRRNWGGWLVRWLVCSRNVTRDAAAAGYHTTRAGGDEI